MGDQSREEGVGSGEDEKEGMLGGIGKERHVRKGGGRC